MSKSILPTIPDSDNRSNDPLPLQVAARWQFGLQHHLIDGVYWYAIQDWIAGATSSSTANSAELWRDMQRNSGYDETRVSIRPLDYVANDGKSYQRDFATDKGLYWIAQHLRSSVKRPVLAAIKEYLAKAGAFLDAARRNPELLINAGVDQYKKRGWSDKQIEARMKGIVKRNEFTDAARDTHIDHNPSYGKLTNSEYEALFGAAKAELVKTLGLTPSQANHFRDHISELALKAIDAAETAAAIKYRHMQALTTDEQITIVQRCARIVAPGFWELAQYAGVDLVTGRPLLKGGTR